MGEVQTRGAPGELVDGVCLMKSSGWGVPDNRAGLARLQHKQNETEGKKGRRGGEQSIEAKVNQNTLELAELAFRLT